VFLDQPTPIYGGSTAAPLFSEIARFALRYLKVPPSPTAATVEPAGKPDNGA
jgi:cell division protein FtsI (penicillin-binding protein 3)